MLKFMTYLFNLIDMKREKKVKIKVKWQLLKQAGTK